MSGIVSAILATLGPILTYLMKKLIDQLVKKDQIVLDNEKKLGKMNALKTEALRAVRFVDINFVQELKEKGEWKEELAKEAKMKAIAKLEDSYGPDGLTDLAMFFQTNSDGLTVLLDQAVEAAIFQNKNPESKPGSLRI